MRIFLPLTAADRSALTTGATRLALDEGRLAWAVTAEARADLNGDEEDLEYEAMQDAVHVALTAAAPDQRIMILAGDVPTGDVTSGPEEAGLFGCRLQRPSTLRLASMHVSELTAAGHEASDTDPGLFWFDASEAADALESLDRGPR